MKKMLKKSAKIKDNVFALRVLAIVMAISVIIPLIAMSPATANNYESSNEIKVSWLIEPTIETDLLGGCINLSLASKGYPIFQDGVGFTITNSGSTKLIFTLIKSNGQTVSKELDGSTLTNQLYSMALSGVSSVDGVIVMQPANYKSVDFYDHNFNLIGQVKSENSLGLSCVGFSEGLAVIGVLSNSGGYSASYSFGYTNTKGEWLLTGYDQATEFSNGVALVVKNGTVALINKKGEIINTYPNFKGSLSDTRLSDGVIIRGKDMYDYDGNIIATGITKSFNEIRAAVFNNGLIKSDSGYVNKNGEVVISFLPDFKGSSFFNGLKKSEEDKGYIGENGNKLYTLRNFTDLEDGLARVELYVSDKVDDNQWTFYVVEKWSSPKSTGKTIFFDTNQNVIYEHSSDSSISITNTDMFHNGLMLVKNDKGKYGYMDTTGKMVTQYEFDKAYHFSEGFAWVQKNLKWGVLKIDGFANNSSSTPTPTYTVTFKDWDGATLKTQTVEKGQSATAPSNPSRDGYTFTGWDKSFSSVTSDLTVTAQYEKKDVPTNKFVMGEDNYRFNNSSKSFGYTDSYKIPFERYKKLYTVSDVAGTWGTEENDYREAWYGSCFGFSTTSVLMNLNKLTIPGSATYTYSLLAPTTPFSEITELIETYQVSWSLYDIWNTALLNRNNYTGLVNAVTAANGSGVVITIAKNSKMDDYHTVVAYDVAQISTGVYALLIYDCNAPDNDKRVMQVNTNSKSFSYYDYGKESTAFFEYVSIDVINNAINTAINDKSKSNGISGPGSRMTISAPSGTRIANLANSTFIQDSSDAYRIVEPSLAPSVAERMRQMWSVPNTDDEIWSAEISDNTVNKDISFFNKDDAMTINSNAESGGVVGTPSQVMVVGDGSKEFDFSISYTTVAMLNDSYKIKGTADSYFSVEVHENKLLLEGDTNSVEVYRRNGKSETVKLIDGTAEIILDTEPEKVITLQIDKPNMTVNGIQKEIDPGRGTVPLISNGRTLLPIRAIAEELGATIEWDSSERKVTITQGSTKISVWIDNRYAYIGSTFVTLDVPPKIINERTMLPIRFVAEALNCTVLWEGTTRTVTIIR